MRRLSRSDAGRDQRGLTALELLIGVSLLSIMSVAAMSMLVATQNRVQYTSKTTESLDGARTTMTRIEKEIRDGASIYEDGDCPVTTCLTFASVPTAGGAVVDVRYHYDLATKIVYRTDGARDPLTNAFAATGNDVPVVTHVQNGTGTPVFCRDTCIKLSETGAVKVTLIVNADTTNPARGVTLTSYLTPRNQ